MSYLEKRQQIDLLQQQINAHGVLSADIKKKINYKFRLDWNYYSNSMEGNTLTMDETRSVMVGNLTVGGKPIKDVLEMKGHDDVISKILQIGAGEVRLSETRIREIHQGIMHEEDETKKAQIGRWKEIPNYIYNYKGERFDFTAPSDVPTEIHNLLNKTNAAIDAIQQNKKNAPHPLDVALQFHLDYVRIHPFYDGNGRTARILTNLLLIAFGYPPFWIKTNEKGIYNQYLGDIQGYGGNPDLFFEFIASTILRAQQLTLDAITGKDISSPDDFDKEIELLKILQNPPKEKIKKSKEVVQTVLKQFYLPLLQELNTHLAKLDVLFEGQLLTLFEGTNGTNKIWISRHILIEDLIKRFDMSSESLSSPYYNYRVVYTLLNYKDKIKFSMEVSFEISFNDTDFNVQVFIGPKMENLASTTIIGSNKKKAALWEGEQDYELCRFPYDTVPNTELITIYTLQIRNDALAYIKQKLIGEFIP